MRLVNNQVDIDALHSSPVLADNILGREVDAFVWNQSIHKLNELLAAEADYDFLTLAGPMAILFPLQWREVNSLPESILNRMAEGINKLKTDKGANSSRRYELQTFLAVAYPGRYFPTPTQSRSGKYHSLTSFEQYSMSMTLHEYHNAAPIRIAAEVMQLDTNADWHLNDDRIPEMVRMYEASSSKPVILTEWEGTMAYMKLMLGESVQPINEDMPIYTYLYNQLEKYKASQHYELFWYKLLELVILTAETTVVLPGRILIPQSTAEQIDNQFTDRNF